MIFITNVTDLVLGLRGFTNYLTKQTLALIYGSNLIQILRFCSNGFNWEKWYL